MEWRFTYQVREEELRKACRQYYGLLMRVRRFYVLDGGLVVVIALWHSCGPNWWSYGLGGLVLLLCSPWVEGLYFAFWWRIVRLTLRWNGTFSMPGDYLLTDEGMEIRRGGDCRKAVWKEQVSGFCRRGEVLLLLRGQRLFGVLRRDMFPLEEAFEEFTDLFRREGFRDLAPFPFRHALVPWGIGVALLVFWGRLIWGGN